ncbi:hypothetical protein [Nocardia sp. NPDC047654]|uniref:hypothetical protein n=1 Tax=Nocardia sp. NPDC047654 TaxID=3364314 RepID=UPI0037175823
MVPYLPVTELLSRSFRTDPILPFKRVPITIPNGMVTGEGGDEAAEKGSTMRLRIGRRSFLHGVGAGFAGSMLVRTRGVAEPLLPPGMDSPLLFHSPRVEPFVDELPRLPVVRGDHHELVAASTTHRFHRDLPESPALGYNGMSYLGPTIEHPAGRPLSVRFTNRMGGHPFAADMDTTVHGVTERFRTDPPSSLHLHGGVTPPGSDRRIDAWAQEQPARSAGRPGVDRAFLVHRTVADPRFVDVTIDPSDREPGSLYGDPRTANWAAGGLARFVTARSWLSTWSEEHTHASAPSDLAGVKAPTLVMALRGDQAAFRRRIQGNARRQRRSARRADRNASSHPLLGRPARGSRANHRALAVLAGPARVGGLSKPGRTTRTASDIRRGHPCQWKSRPRARMSSRNSRR